MAGKRVNLEKSGGRRISFYAEVGAYFTAEGDFHEAAFRSSLKDKLIETGKDQADDARLPVQAKWLSSYLDDILAYLTGKGMAQASVRLFTAAMDEAGQMGLPEIVLSPKLLGDILRAASPAAPEKPQHRQSADEKKRIIYSAALKIFSEEGYHQATMEKIAALSGVAKGTVYTYFKSKEDLLDQLLEEYYQEIVGRISAICSKETDILQQIRELIVFWVHFIEDNPLVYRLIQSEAIFQRPGGKTMFYDYIVSHLPMLKERIVALNREHRLKTTSFYPTFYGALGFIDGVAQRWFRCQMEYPLTDEIPVILEVLLNGFVGERNSNTSYFPSPEPEDG
jgi:AcrR family transcriptional regulator